MVTANTSHTTLKTGARVSLKTVFLASTAKPRGGWKVRLLLPGQVHPMEYDGKSAQEVFNRVRGDLDRNNVTMSDESVWLNLNMTWMDRVDSRFWLLLREDLLSLIAKDADEKKPVPGRQLTPPSLWGSRAWNAMGLLLANDHYEWSGFLDLVRIVLSLTNPTTNPIMGCQECYVDFGQEVGRLETGPALSREQAREWLFAFHNRVNERIGKPVLTRAQAWHDNFWQ